MSTVLIITGGGGLGFTELAHAMDRFEVSLVAPARPVALLHPKAPAPLSAIDAYKLAKGEAKRARKAQMRRNGGKL